MAIIFEDYCNSSIVLGETTEITKVKETMINPSGGLVHYLNNNSNDDDKDNNGLAVTEQMQQRATDKVNALQRILKLPAATDILKWHVSRGSPILEKVALDYLATPASSLPAERANSIASRIWENWSRLSDKIFHAEICIRLWMKLFNAVGINLPNNIKAEYGSLDHNELFGLDKYNNISDPIIEYMIDDSDGAYVPHEKRICEAHD